MLKPLVRMLIIMSSHGVSVRLSLARLHNGKVVETDQAMNDSPGKVRL